MLKFLYIFVLLTLLSNVSTGNTYLKISSENSRFLPSLDLNVNTRMSSCDFFNMKLIPLTQGKFAQVDDEDYDFLMQWKWYAHKFRNTFYAGRNKPTLNGKRGTIKMHRVLMGLDEKDKIEVDHRDRNGLNNQKFNLRKATKQQNMHNRISGKKKASNYKGVTVAKYKVKGKEYCYWRVIIKFGGKNKSIGMYPFTPEGEIEAAKCYDQAAKKYFGEFACLNFKE